MKRNIMTKSLSLILSIVMVITMVPIFAIGSSAEETTTIQNGDTITFGSYPQTKVTDEDTLNALADTEKTWVSYGYMESQNTPGDYMQYCDIDIDGDGTNDYRGVKFSKYRLLM